MWGRIEVCTNLNCKYSPNYKTAPNYQLTISSASGLSGFLSGWYFRANLRYFFLISSFVDVLGISNSWYKLSPVLLKLWAWGLLNPIMAKNQKVNILEFGLEILTKVDVYHFQTQLPGRFHFPGFLYLVLQETAY